MSGQTHTHTRLMMGREGGQEGCIFRAHFSPLVSLSLALLPESSTRQREPGKGVSTSESIERMNERKLMLIKTGSSNQQVMKVDRTKPPKRRQVPELSRSISRHWCLDEENDYAIESGGTLFPVPAAYTMPYARPALNRNQHTDGT